MKTQPSSTNRFGFITILALSLMCWQIRAQFSDTLPPQLVSLSFSPGSVDVTASDQVVGLTLHLTDDLSGIDLNAPASYWAYVQINSPSSRQSQPIYLRNFTLIAGGTDLDGTWEGTFTMPKSAENGIWHVNYVNFFDQAGNSTYLSGNQLQGLPALTVISVPDITPPTVVALSLDKAAIDTSLAGVLVTATLQITDLTSGFGSGANFYDNRMYVEADFSGNLPPGYRVPSAYTSSFQWVSGDAHSGTWRIGLWFPRYCPSGVWNLRLQLTDNAGNYLWMNTQNLADARLSNQITVTSNPSDTKALTLTSGKLSISPITIDTSASARDVIVSVEAADDLSGIQFVFVELRSPSGGQWKYVFIYPDFANPQQLQTIAGPITFPRYSEAGTWKVFYIETRDQAGNGESLDSTALEARGLSATLNVILPSLNTDGSVGGAGGTVADGTFGDRAQLTVPANALNESTTVAIDVLQDPLDVPMPTGFSAPGTYYVNIHLEPEPTFPLGPPGLTVVLPLVSPMPAGTILNFFRIDGVTGNLVQAIGVSGNPVQGTVDASGLSATFTGVARLSTVVGLIQAPLPCDPNPVMGPGGHYYQAVVAQAISWPDANAAANAHSFGCLKGHLAVITSAEEDAFIDSLRANCALGELWAGGSQPLGETVPTENWSWVQPGGPISGVNGTATYSNWLPSQPDDYAGPGSEQYLGIGLFGSFGWNDEGNTALISGYVIEYEDYLPPAVTCPSNITVCSDPVTCTQVVTYTSTAHDDCSGVAVMACLPPSGATYKVGTTRVTCTAVDQAGNVGSCSFDVTVNVCGKCPLSQGYWKNHPQNWPARALPMALGNVAYDQPTLLQILNAPVGSGKKADASLILASQLIAAKLNLANGSTPCPISTTIDTADGLIGSGTIPSVPVTSPNTVKGTQMTALADKLDQFNNGLLSSGCIP